MASNVVATEQKRNETKSKKASKEKVKRVSLKERKVLIQKKRERTWKRKTRRQYIYGRVNEKIRWVGF